MKEIDFNDYAEGDIVYVEKIPIGVIGRNKEGQLVFLESGKVDFATFGGIAEESDLLNQMDYIWNQTENLEKNRRELMKRWRQLYARVKVIRSNREV